jgi:hypothetical protein
VDEVKVCLQNYGQHVALMQVVFTITRIRAVIYGYVRHLFGAQVCERRCGEGIALKGRGEGGSRGREKRFMSARRKTFVCI